MDRKYLTNTEDFEKMFALLYSPSEVRKSLDACLNFLPIIAVLGNALKDPIFQMFIGQETFL